MKELTIHLKLGGKSPLYEQIYQYIRADIVKGKITPGEKLPSTRMLSRHLQVSRSTVQLAYDQLVSEGYLETVPQSGYYACGMEELFFLAGKEKNESLQISQKSEECWQYDFSPNAVEWPEASMSAWRKATRSMLQENMEELFSSGASMGEENLRGAIAEYLHQARGVNCGIHQIIIGAGNEYLLMLLSQILPGVSSIAMESPTYRQACGIFQNLGWQVVSVPMDGEGMRPGELASCKAGLAYVMPSHQFPLGTVMPMKRRMELLNWAGQAEGRYLIEDDYDSEFRYRGMPIPSLQGSDPFDRVIYLGTFSKSIAPAIRVSYMVLPRELVGPYQKRCGFYSSTVSRIQQQTLFWFIKDGYFERHLNKLRRIYRSRHDALLNALKGREWVERIYGEDAGLHILVEVKTDEAAIVEAAKSKGIRVYGLGEYAIGEPEMHPKPTLLLGYAGMKEERIGEGIALLDGILR